MIIESAFYNLPELLMLGSSDKETYEATLINRMAMGVLTGLTARNIELPMKRIHIEKPYPDINKEYCPGRADLFIDLSSIYSSSFHRRYGMNSDNWIEAKYFGGIGRQSSAQAKTYNAGIIAQDLLRLCLFVKEERSKSRNNARYLVLLFNRRPEEYLSLQRNSVVQSWILPLLQPGRGHITIDIQKQPKSCIKAIGKILYERKPKLIVELNYMTHLFEPLKVNIINAPWGALIRIAEFKVSMDNTTLHFDEMSEEIWSKDKHEKQDSIADQYYAHIKGKG